MTRHGFWESPLSAQAVVAAEAAVDGLSGVRAGDGRVVWAENRPQEGGRVTLIEHLAEGPTEILPGEYSVRSAVHENGGAAFSVIDGDVYFVNWEDQRIYRMESGTDTGVPEAITPEPPSPRSWRYGAISGGGGVLYCIRERHEADEVVNEIIRIDDDVVTTIAAGADFYDCPTPAPGGGKLAWVEWDHPNMPWDQTRLVVADSDGANTVVLASGAAIQQPKWMHDDTLVYIDDRTGYWNLYRHSLSTSAEEPVHPTEHDMAEAPFVLGISTYAIPDPDRIVALCHTEGVEELGLVDDGGFHPCAPGLTFIRGLGSDDGTVFFLGGSPTEKAAVYRLDGVGDVQRLSAPAETNLEDSFVSVGEHLSFTSTGGRTTHAIVYPPVNPDSNVPADSLPPLIIMIHGGPTGHAVPLLRPEIQYWTTRGFAVADVNYGGSTGYGTAYRELLRDAWGVVDVDDCIAVANGLADQGAVDRSGMFIRGGSAGGFTTLAVLVASDIFAAGGNLFGVSDLAALARDTHKFESRYLDGLIGPYPEAAAVYEERSPIHHLADFETPLIVFQGSDDKVVPPEQSRSIVSALEDKGIPVEYHEFEGEGHGFRRAENMITVLERELAFYQDRLKSAP